MRVKNPLDQVSRFGKRVNFGMIKETNDGLLRAHIQQMREK